MGDPNDPTLDVSFHSASDLTQKIEMVLEAGTYKVPVLATLLGGTFNISPFVPEVDFDSTGVALTTAWSKLKEVTTTQGKIDFIATSLGSSNYKIRLTVDGVEVFDLAMSDLNAIGLSNAENVDIWSETALKNFRYRPQTPVDFTTGFKVEAAMTTGTGTIKYMINHRVRN